MRLYLFYSFIEIHCSSKVVKISEKGSIYYNRSHLFYAAWRRRLAILVCLGGALMCYLYYRHNRYCEPYMYRYEYPNTLHYYMLHVQ